MTITNKLYVISECLSPGINETSWDWGFRNDPIDANHSGTIVEYRMENTISIRTENSGFPRKYIDARLEDDILIIFTTADFANYEDLETETEIQLRIDFTCSSNSKLFVFYQPINEANNNDPVFTEATYEITVKLPLHKGFDLTYYKVRIVFSIPKKMIPIEFLI